MIQNKILVGLAALLIIGMTSVFTVSQTEKAIKFELGKIVRDDYEPGLYFKVPIYNSIKKFDARIQTMDAKPERFLTAEKKNVIVDSFVKWRIGNVSTFYTTVAGDIDQANLRLDQIIKDAFRSEFSKRNIKQLISTDRSAIRDILTNNSKAVAAALGMEIVDVQVMRIDLPPEVSSSVFRRMEAERERVARELLMPTGSALLRWQMHFAMQKNCVVKVMQHLQKFTPRLSVRILNFLLFTVV
jgi:membrane protease subunit HflC